MPIKKILIFLFISSTTLIAQFKSGDVRLGGSVSYEHDYWDNEPNKSTFNILPECGFFILDNFSLQITGYTVIYFYPKNWNSDPDCDLGCGLGAKYYYRRFYLGSSFVYKKWNSIPPRNTLLLETGYLIKLNPKVFLDLGWDFTTGISDANRNTSRIRFEVGVVAFL